MKSLRNIDIWHGPLAKTEVEFWRWNGTGFEMKLFYPNEMSLSRLEETLNEYHFNPDFSFAPEYIKLSFGV